MGMSPDTECKTVIFDVIGMIGIAIAALAYAPQIFHLAHEQCSAGVSRRAWSMWIASSVLVGALAVHRNDPIFILLQAASLASATVILLLAVRYRGMVCALHARQFPGRISAGSDRV